MTAVAFSACRLLKPRWDATLKVQDNTDLVLTGATQLQWDASLVGIGIPSLSLPGQDGSKFGPSADRPMPRSSRSLPVSFSRKMDKLHVQTQTFPTKVTKVPGFARQRRSARLSRTFRRGPDVIRLNSGSASWRQDCCTKASLGPNLDLKGTQRFPKQRTLKAYLFSLWTNCTCWCSAMKLARILAVICLFWTLVSIVIQYFHISSQSQMPLMIHMHCFNSSLCGTTFSEA